jgi:hypothetical protein
MKRFQFLSQIAFCCAALACAAQPALASPMEAFSFTSADFATYDSVTGELGYTFTTGSNPIAVTALGYINDGFNGTHTISIFDTTTQTLVSGATASVTTIGGGSTDTTFTYTDLSAPVTLAANTNYEIVSQYFNNEHYFIHAQGLTSNGGLTIGDAVYYYPVQLTPIFTSNTAAGNDIGDFGPNFKFVGVPEPLSLCLFGAGLAGAAALRRRKKA